jgi:hypothetical protein
VANNNYPQITSVTSEALQAQIRNLLPSQEGFGTDLMAQNVIVPIIDLTSAAEGSTVPEILQTAIAFGSQTSFEVSNQTTTLANSTGFWRFQGGSTAVSGANTQNVFRLTDGLATKTIWGHALKAYGSLITTVTFDLVVFLAAGESLVCVSDNSLNVVSGSYRQIADVNGNLVNPSGFNPQ